MRTTITIDEHLLDEVRRRAAELRTTVSEVISDSLRDSFLRRQGGSREPFRVHPFRGGEPQPAVDLDDNAALLELMDRSS